MNDTTRTEYGIQWEDGTRTLAPGDTGASQLDEARQIKAVFPAVSILTRTVRVGEWTAAN